MTFPRLSSLRCPEPGLLLGAVLPVCYVPGWTDSAIPTQWLILPIALTLMLWGRIKMTSLHWVGLAFLVWVVVSLAWTESLPDGVMGLVQWLVIGGAFCLGASRDPRPIFVGLAIGLSINVILAILWKLGLRAVEQESVGYPAGLFFAPNVFGSALALVLVAAIVFRIWWYLPIGLLGLFLSHFRAGVLSIAAAGLVWLWSKSKRGTIIAGLAFILAAGALLWTKDLSSLGQRLSLWHDLAPHLRWEGAGVGSYFHLYPTMIDWAVVPNQRFLHPYNDFLEVIFEFGLGSCALWLILILALEVPLAARLILVAFLEQSLSFFPLALPLSAFAAALITGHLAGQRHLLRVERPARRPSFLPRLGRGRYGLAGSGRRPLPLEPNHSYQAGIPRLGYSAVGGNAEGPRKGP